MTPTKDDLIPLERLVRASAVLRVLAHPHRLAICDFLLARQGPVSAVAGYLGLPSNVVSQHLNVMRAYGLLKSSRRGRTVYYTVTDPRPGWLLEYVRKQMPVDKEFQM